MLLEVVLSLLLIYSAGSTIIDHKISNLEEELTAVEASQVAETFIEAGLDGFRLLRVRYTKEDIDTCNMVLTSTFEVQLQSTGEVYEISSDSNITDAVNCKSKRKLVEGIQGGNLTRVQQFIKDRDDTVRLVDISVDQFRIDMAELEQKDIRIVSSNYTYQFGFDEGVDTDAELVELHVRMVNTGNEYVVNIVGDIELSGPIHPRTRPYPPKVLLSLLGGGSYSKMKRVKKGSS
nr:uncharacterized protein LOC109406683 [Aedes albopictus]